MTETVDPTRAVIALNQSYLAAAAELCRQQPRMARILLHISAEHVAAFAAVTALDLARVNAIPFALVRPHASVLKILQAQSAAEIFAPTQAAVDRVLNETHDAG